GTCKPPPTSGATASPMSDVAIADREPRPRTGEHLGDGCVDAVDVHDPHHGPVMRRATDVDRYHSARTSHIIAFGHRVSRRSKHRMEPRRSDVFDAAVREQIAIEQATLDELHQRLEQLRRRTGERLAATYRQPVTGTHQSRI